MAKFTSTRQYQSRSMTLVLCAIASLILLGCDSLTGVSESEGVADLEQICQQFTYIPRTQQPAARRLTTIIAEQRIQASDGRGNQRVTLEENSPFMVLLNRFPGFGQTSERFLVQVYDVRLDGHTQFSIRFPVYRHPSFIAILSEGFTEHTCSRFSNSSTFEDLASGKFIDE